MGPSGSESVKVWLCSHLLPDLLGFLSTPFSFNSNEFGSRFSFAEKLRVNRLPVFARDVSALSVDIDRDVSTGACVSTVMLLVLLFACVLLSPIFPARSLYVMLKVVARFASQEVTG